MDFTATPPPAAPPAALPAALADLETPALLLDAPRLQANLRRMAQRMAALGVRLRPHVKTAKCLPVAAATDAANLAAGVPGAAEYGPITVSTLREVDQFAAAGWRDITYAVGLTANKFAHVRRLLDAGVALTVILDSVDAARVLSAAAAAWPTPVQVLIEIDTDGQRAGLRPDVAALLDVAAALSGPGVRLDGVLTHCGGAYHGHGEAALRAIAEQERAGAVHAAERLRAAGFAAPVVSVGSTPTALFAEHLAGVTEVRAGVYVFMDLMMAALGVCRLDEIAASVLTAVIGHQPDRGWTLIDAGWMALSRDRGLAGEFTDQGLGLVCDAAGTPIGEDGAGGGEWIVSAANQEHGIVTHRSGDPARRLELPVGTLLRVLPNHACATAAQHAHYELLGADGRVNGRWARFMGW